MRKPIVAHLVTDRAGHVYELPPLPGFGTPIVTQSAMFEEDPMPLTVLGDEAVRDFTLTSFPNIDAESFPPLDLREEAMNALWGAQREGVNLWRIDIEGEAEAAYALVLATSARIGIAWGANATWADTTGDTYDDVNLWLNDSEAWEARN